MLADFHYIFFWWLTIFVLSLLSLPLTFSIFKKFWDKGYIFAKTISCFLIAYLIFILGVCKILPFTVGGILLVAVIFGVINYRFFVKNLPEFKHFLKKNWRIFLFEEIIFFIVLTLWSYLRGFAPDIEGLEKFMDWGFVNTILRSRFSPPADMWYAGEPINYYYFGHFVCALVTKISGISSQITYNLAIATLCALSFTSTFSLTSNLIFHSLKKKAGKFFIVGGLLSALLLTFGGNFHLAFRLGRGVFKYHETLAQASQNYWYPDATRFIGFDPDTTDKNIHEFPIYSFVVADLHGHLNDLPLVLFFTAFLFATLALSQKISSLIFIPSGFILSLAYMTNAWDFAVYGLLFALTFLLLSQDLKRTFIQGILTIASWFVFTLPFSINFKPMMEGLMFSDTHSPFYQLFILYGGFWLISLPFIIFLLKNRRRQRYLPTDFFVFALIALASFLIIIPEIIYIKDIYVFDYRRANTMFKLVYQAFILYSLAAGYIFIRLRASLWYKLLFCLVFILHMSYTYFPIKSYYSLKKYQGLRGVNFLEISYPDNLAAINWLNQNVTGQPHILEASGDSYTTFNQVSMATGLPTIQGWLVHEWLWRGGYDAPAARAAEVDQVYKFLSNQLFTNTSLETEIEEYIIMPGDSLWHISRQKLDNEYLWPEIAKTNNIESPYIIHPNQKLIIPIQKPITPPTNNVTNIEEIKNILYKYQVKYIFIGAKEFEKYPDIDLSNLQAFNASLVFNSGSTYIYQLP